MATSAPQYRVVTASQCLMSALASTMWRKEAWDALALHNKAIPLLCMWVCAFICPHYNRYTFLCKARKWIYRYYILCVEFTLLDHFSPLKARHLSWLFIFNSLYCYQKERKQLLGEYPFEGIWFTFCSLFREGTKTLTRWVVVRLS